jgi:membrane associated rhomboid family serine protease
MALTPCPECGNDVSDQARSCPQCGYPLQKAGDAIKQETVTRLRTVRFTWIVCALVLVGFAFSLAFGTELIDLLALEPQAVANGSIHLLITYAFLHGGFSHLLGSVIGIAVFGCLLEPRLGPVRTALAFAVGAIVAGLVYVVWTMKTGAPQAPYIGSTAGLYALFGAYCVVLRTQRKNVRRWERVCGVMLGIFMVLSLISPTPAIIGSNIAAIAVGTLIALTRLRDSRAQTRTEEVTNRCT